MHFVILKIRFRTFFYRRFSNHKNYNPDCVKKKLDAIKSRLLRYLPPKKTVFFMKRTRPNNKFTYDNLYF